MLSDSMKQEMDIAALTDLYTYLDDFTIGTEGNTLGQRMKSIASTHPKVLKTDEYKAIMSALDQHDEWKNIEIIDQSSNSTNRWTDDPIQAVCFKNGNDYYVAYRGTGNGRWMDNGEGTTAASTYMQEEATVYFDKLIYNHKLENIHEKGGRLIVTGHSKGANEAQYVTMTSKYRDLIDNCYSYDGQGFSKKADDKFKDINGKEQYEQQKDKIYSICGKDDPVNVIGKKQMASKNHTYYVNYADMGIISVHDLTAMVCHEKNGEYTGLSWGIENDGHGELGEIGKFAKCLNENLQELDEDDLNSSAKVTMFIIDIIMHIKSNSTYENLTDQHITFRDLIRFGANGIPVVIKTLVATPEGRKILFEIAKEGIKVA